MAARCSNRCGTRAATTTPASRRCGSSTGSPRPAAWQPTASAASRSRRPPPAATADRRPAPPPPTPTTAGWPTPPCTEQGETTMVKAPHWAHVIHEFLRPGHSRLSRVNIPPLDGPLRPNSALEELSPLAGGEVAEPTDVLPQADGSVLVSSGCRVLRLGMGGAAGVSVVAEVGGPVTTLAAGPSGALLAGVGGVGVVRIDSSGGAEPLVTEAGGHPLT